MENIIPFEYGYMYQVIKSPNETDKDELQRLVSMEKTQPYYEGNQYNNDAPWGNIHDKFLSGEYLCPIGFITNTQKVIAQITVSEKEEIHNLLSMEYNNFKKNTLKKRNNRIAWLEIPAQLFIRNFEKVL